MFLHEFRNEQREGDAVNDSALDQQAQGSRFNTQHCRKHISKQNKMWSGLRGKEKAVQDHFLFSQHAWHILSSGPRLSDLRPFFHLNPFSYSVNPFLMFRTKQTSSSVHRTLISKPWRSLFYCINLFYLSPCEHPHPLLPKASMWFFMKHVILVCVLIGSYYDLTFIFLLLSLKAFKIPTQSPSGTAPSCIARVTLPPSFCPPRPLSSTFLQARVLALLPSLCYSMVAERLWNCCLASMLTHPTAFAVLILYCVSFLNVRKLAMLCWVSYPNCLWARFLSQQ